MDAKSDRKTEKSTLLSWKCGDWIEVVWQVKKHKWQAKICLAIIFFYFEPCKPFNNRSSFHVFLLFEQFSVHVHFGFHSHKT